MEKLTELDVKSEQFKIVLNETIKSIVIQSMGWNITGPYKTKNIKTKTSFYELIDYYFKNSSEDEKFKKYISFLDSIVENVKLLFPFINLKGITMDWSIEELQNQIYAMFNTIPEITLADVPRVGKPKNVKSDDRKKIEVKLEKIFRECFNIPKNKKFKRIRFEKIALTFIFNRPNDLSIKQYEREKLDEIREKFKEMLIETFPDMKDKRFYIGDYTTFTEIITKLKTIYKF